MAIPKKGSRKIIVNNEKYKWLIRKKGTYSQTVFGNGKLHIAIELEENPGASLFIISDRSHPNDIETKSINPIKPSDISNWILQAYDLGWNPSDMGKPLQTRIINGKMELV
ncbi:hypothetical protein [Tenacibaculum sp. 190524A05c]|uniref:Uncharacterized protein n=1 Tax=Tenacibaculum platacis TaxID=3137852 RepID=A0ABM9P0T3_9FLAO